jgi:hypothetical protein
MTNLLGVLERAWEGGFSTRSDFARRNAEEVAAAACLGLITTRQTNSSYGRSWRITPSGCRLLFKQGALS